MQIFVTAFSFLLLTFSVYAHVSEDFKACRQFFYRELLPVWPPNRDHVEICQNYENNYYFATLYDTRYRIPVYSAYVFEKGLYHRMGHWFVEPQLVDKSLDKEMTCADELLQNPKVSKDKLEESQAVFEDYRQGLLDEYELNRGQLNPKGHHEDLASVVTYTLTNVVPQNHNLNNGAWSAYVQDLKKTYKRCPKVYVVVGALPSTDPERWVRREQKNRVNIPDYLWNAYCCVDKSGSAQSSGAAVAKNTNGSAVQRCSLHSLQEFFRKLNKTTEVFKHCDPKPNASNDEGDCSSVVYTDRNSSLSPPTLNTNGVFV